MPKIIKDEQQKEIDIYVLISQINKEAYVWKVKKGNHYSAYKKHVNGQKTQTKELFKKSEEQKNFPKMYLLESLNVTEHTAFSYCVAWTKYFIEHGFDVIASERLLAYIKYMKRDAKTIYQCIEKVSLDEVLNKEHLLVKSYQRIEKKSPSKNQIKISVNSKEYETIRKKAAEAKMTMSRYCKNTALKGAIVSIDALPMYEYFGDTQEAVNLLRQILYAFYQNGRYYPADLENIQAMVEQVLRSQENVSECYLKYAKEVKKILPQ